MHNPIKIPFAKVETDPQNSHQNQLKDSLVEKAGQAFAKKKPDKKVMVIDPRWRILAQSIIHTAAKKPSYS